MSLTAAEVDQFFDECGPDDEGFVHQARLRQIYHDFHHINSAGEAESTKSKADERQDTLLDRKKFATLVNSWQVPSKLKESAAFDAESRTYESKLPKGRRLKAHWATEGPQSTFIFAIICLQTGLAVWLLIKELRNKERLQLLGWGVVVAKVSTGVLYPTLALLLLSSSRTLATWLRRWRFCTKFINWDLSQVFHIQMAYTAIFFSVLHTVGHVGGTFYRLDKSPPGAATLLLHNFPLGRPTYGMLLLSLPGLTGLFSIISIALIAMFSQARVRTRFFEAFQLVHLLVYPLIVLLAIHGTKAWLQAPMLGYWLVLPGCLLSYERLERIARNFQPIDLQIIPQQSEVVMLKLHNNVPWKVSPGQYVLICVPAISHAQWHPFSISSYSRNELVLHVRTSSGRWTKALQSSTATTAYIDGPFGGPADKFAGFDRTIVIGTGIGITPYIGVLSNKIATDISARRGSLRGAQQCIDFHWIVRDVAVFSWFSALLNLVASTHVGVKVNNYLTGKEKTMARYVFSVLSDRGVSNISTSNVTQKTSLLTGLDNRTHFGRPDMAGILEENRKNLPEGFRGRVGVFFCGPKYVGMELSDRCTRMTAEGDQMVLWDFIGEVF